MQLIIDIQNALDSPAMPGEIPSSADMQNWLLKALAVAEYTQSSAELTVRIVEPEESQQLNHQYRNKDKPTNVLSFPFEAPPQVPCDLLGDLVICQKVVVDEAKEQHKNLSNHWAHMLVHGTLHLLGYDHIETEEAEEMEALEIDILVQLGFSNPYQVN